MMTDDTVDIYLLWWLSLGDHRSCYDLVWALCLVVLCDAQREERRWRMFQQKVVFSRFIPLFLLKGRAVLDVGFVCCVRLFWK